MKTKAFYLIILTLLVCACKKNKNEQPNAADYDFEATVVLVKIKSGVGIDQVFNFINGLDVEVEKISNNVYTSNLPSDSLQYVLDYLNAKDYTNDGVTWFVSGYLNYQTEQITIFPKFFHIKELKNQEDWLENINKLKLVEQVNLETSGVSMVLHVPEGKEQKWVDRLKAYDIVERAGLNYYIPIELHN